MPGKESAMFTHHETVQLHDTDAYGIIFFANQLKFCHNAFQALLEHVGQRMPPARPVSGSMLVIVHIESDYHAPVHLGDRLAIQLAIAAFGTTSLTVRFRLVNQDGVVVGTVTSVHVAIDVLSSAKSPLPAALRAALAPHLGTP
jgi:1,4-dihydroxy-2-naphthoyl-CoA hydrolase